MLKLNGLAVPYFFFPGGEIQVKLPENIPTERAILTWKPSLPDHILLLMLTVNALHNQGISDIDLEVLYLPYARQDRVCSAGEAFSLEVICELLDSMGLSTIRLWDVHTPYTAMPLMTRTFVIHTDVQDIFARYKVLEDYDESNLVLCAPDKGAIQRVQEIATSFKMLSPICLDKVRSRETGKITSLLFNQNNRSIKGFNVMIVDDICDGGATFIQAAEVLKQYGAENLFLYVTHGIFSNGLEQLLKYFGHITCHHLLHDTKFTSNKHLTVLQGEHYDTESTICD